ncbi:MAG TPA: ferrous iron transport protein A [Candidatus Ornithoclostridium faecavium]|nr:ferrous iron transport protein A [Candidatus Ornithoclostridium faecavium]
MPIVFAPQGENLRVIRVLADDKTKKHLENLGITIGAELTVLSVSGGSVIVMVKDSRLALDKGVATKILVAV